MKYAGHAVATLFALCACAEPSPPVDEEWGEGSGSGSGESIESIELTLSDLQPGWRVTTTRSTQHASPVESTRVSDGAPITLSASPTDVVVATVTDANGVLIVTHAMKAPCTMAASRQLRVPSEYATIQAAVDAALPGETVKVAGGTYTESIRMRPGVCLLGSGAKHTVLDAQGEGRTLVDLTSAPGSVVSGFTLRGTSQPEGCAQPADPFLCSGNWYRAGIYLGGEAWEDPTNDAPPIIANNMFDGNDTGLMFYWRSSGIVRNNVFVGNRVGFVANHFQDRALIANNVFVDNTELAIGNQAAYLDIIDNIIIGSREAIRFEYIQTGHIRCNIFWNNDVNQADTHIVPPRFTIGSDGNVEVEPKLVGNGDYHLTPGSPGRDKGCHGNAALEPDGSLPDIGAYGGPLAAWADL